MNDTEKFLFDLQGFLKVPDFLTPAEIDALNAAFDANEDKRGEDGNHNTGGSDALEGRRRGMFAGMLEWEKPHCLPFRALLAHKKFIPYLDALFGRGWKMDHSPFMLCGGKGAEGLILHGSTSRHFNGSQYYAYANDQMRCGMIVCQFQLADVQGGRRRVVRDPRQPQGQLPAAAKNLPLAGATAKLCTTSPARTGDMVIFNEATLHGTLPWTAEHERRSLLYRYSPKYLHFAGGTYQTSQPAWVGELTEAQQAVLEPPYIYNRPLVEADGETVVRPRTG